MEHTFFKKDELKVVTVTKKKGELVVIGSDGDIIVLLSEETKIWEVKRLSITYTHTEPDWVHSYFSLEDPRILWKQDADTKEYRERMMRERKEEYESEETARIYEQLKLKKLKEKEEKYRVHNVWYKRLYRYTRRKLSKSNKDSRLLKASVLKE